MVDGLCKVDFIKGYQNLSKMALDEGLPRELSMELWDVPMSHHCSLAMVALGTGCQELCALTTTEPTTSTSVFARGHLYSI